MRLYFENPVGRLLEHPDGYALVQYNEGARDFDTFRAFLTHTHRLLRRHSWHKLLADQRKMASYTDEERDWVLNAWLTQSADDGYELYGAILINKDELDAHPALSAVIDSVQEQSALRYRMFEDEAAAINWLLQLQ